jgi:hypothetical protein
MKNTSKALLFIFILILLPVYTHNAHAGQLAGFRALRVPVPDAETGCTMGDANAFQECRQAYFLKQQNQILKSQRVQTVAPQKEVASPTTSDLENRLQTMESQLNALNTQQSVTGSSQTQNADGMAVPILPFALILVFTIIVTAIITLYVGMKQPFKK